MKIKLLIIPFIALILITGIFYFQANFGRIDKTSGLYKAIGQVFVKSGLTDDKLVKKIVDENKMAGRRYVTVFVEYDAPKSFIWRNFDRALRIALKKSAFRISDVEQSFEKRRECHTVIINYGKFDVLTIKINHRIKAVALPAVEKVFARPKIAIVVDDFGYSRNNISAFLALKQPITFSILPSERFSSEVAGLAKSRGFETMLHLPLEAEGPDVPEEADTIKVGMSEREVLLRLEKDLASVPGIDGVNNHQGSKATADTAVMTTVIRRLKQKGLFFLDSVTTPKSVGIAVAKSFGIRYAKRDIFLDNSNNTAAIEKQLAALKALAFKRGRAIAICHDRKNTAAVLARIMPQMEREGIEFVKMSDLVNS